MLAITRNTPLFHSVPALQAGDKILHILNLSWLLYIRENILTLSKILVILIILEMLGVVDLLLIFWLYQIFFGFHVRVLGNLSV